MGENQTQIAIRNNSYEIAVFEGDNDSLYFWLKNYLEHAVTIAESSRKVQVRDLSLCIRFAEKEGTVVRPVWTPRLSRAFIDFLRTTLSSLHRVNAVKPSTECVLQIVVQDLYTSLQIRLNTLNGSLYTSSHFSS
jgi:hypothetical protein